jgi:hypothetical protein
MVIGRVLILSTKIFGKMGHAWRQLPIGAMSGQM